MKNTRTFLILAVVALASAACDGILDVSDPTRVEEEDLTGPAGVELLRGEAVTQLYNAVAYGAYHGGLVADEIVYVPSSYGLQNGTLYTQTVLDQRMLRGNDADRLATRVYGYWSEARIAATHAINWFERYGSEAQRPTVGQLLAVKGYATVGMGEQICSGLPLHEVDWDRPVYSGPLTTEQVFETAVETLDRAVTAAADNEAFASFARVAHGRALLALGRFDEAAAAVDGVPTDFEFQGEYGGSNPAKRNQMRMTYSSTGANETVPDREGGNGIDYRSANDPRLELEYLGDAHEGTEVYIPVKYSAPDSPIVIASGIEARLIEAEAALNAGDASWVGILNDLRATAIAPAMDPLDDPGTEAERVDLLFRERAFWLYGTGHRLGDMRRLVAHYGRDAEDVFPTGEYFLGGGYQGGTSLPFDLDGEDWAGQGVTGCLD